MGEGRGKLEALIADLEAKKAELSKLIEEYELMLPHLTSAREALDQAGIKDTGPRAAQPSAPQPAAAAPPPPPPPPPPAPPKSAKPQPAEEPAPAAPARRSIASLVAEEEAAGDEASH
jgi:hypothetical protein